MQPAHDPRGAQDVCSLLAYFTQLLAQPWDAAPPGAADQREPGASPALGAPGALMERYAALQSFTVEALATICAVPAPPPPGMVGPTAPRSMRLRVAKAPMAECDAEFEYRVMGAGGLVAANA